MRHRPATCDGCGKPLWRDYLSTAGLDICCCLKSSKTLPQMYDERVEEISRLRAELAKANALLLTYGWHRDECAFLEVCDDCDCGFESLLREALTINKAARKGEGE